MPHKPVLQAPFLPDVGHRGSHQAATSWSTNAQYHEGMSLDTYQCALDVLKRWLPGRQWRLEKPGTGWRKTCFIAISGQEKYFIKFDVPVAILSRLGEIGVAPKVLFAGEHDGVPYVIQEFVSGAHPESPGWMREHVDELASIITTYHEDARLRTELAATCPTELPQHLLPDLEWLSGRFHACCAGYLRTAEVQRGFKRLLADSMLLQPEPLVPVHNDPSPTNILLVGNRFVFLDWDEITLCDPMRDVGLLLWWNFPPDEWHAFFERSGLELTAARTRKMYWFAARASLDIALWHAEHGVDGRGFAEDFLAAVKQAANPKGY